MPIDPSRKRLDTTLRLFARFAGGKPPSVRLLLKAAGPASRPADLGDQVQALDLAERVHWTDALGLPHPMPDAALNLLYNACEVGLNTSQGEGWGLIAYEHAAAGAAQIVPHHASAGAWRGYRACIPTSARAPDGVSSFGCADIDEGLALQMLERLYADTAFRADAGRQARRIAMQPELDWSVIGAAWRQLVRSVLAARTRA
ncbi:MAG: glycosyltransferase [Rubrivivax sp.]